MLPVRRAVSSINRMLVLRPRRGVRPVRTEVLCLVPWVLEAETQGGRDD